MNIALITGGSAGLGLATARELAERNWTLILDGRNPDRLREVRSELSRRTKVTAIAGDVADAGHRRALMTALAQAGRLDLLMNNASTLGPIPLRPLVEIEPEQLHQVLAVNAIAPLELIRSALGFLLAGDGVVLNVSSDAAIEHYERWGAYGLSKAALDHASATLAAENPGLRIYSFDPGDMRTQMHQQAFLGEDISDRPDPATVVPTLLQLLGAGGAQRRASGRYRVADPGLGATDDHSATARN